MDFYDISTSTLRFTRGKTTPLLVLKFFGHSLEPPHVDRYWPWNMALAAAKKKTGEPRRKKQRPDFFPWNTGWFNRDPYNGLLHCFIRILVSWLFSTIPAKLCNKRHPLVKKKTKQPRGPVFFVAKLWKFGEVLQDLVFFAASDVGPRSPLQIIITNLSLIEGLCFFGEANRDAKILQQQTHPPKKKKKTGFLVALSIHGWKWKIGLRGKL